MKTYYNSIESSNIAAIGYKIGHDMKFGILRVWFKGKTDLKVYEYRFITLEIIKEFLAAESKGKFFSSRIKAAYEGLPVTPEAAQIWIDEAQNFEEIISGANS